jgi:hypothetical protein
LENITHKQYRDIGLKQFQVNKEFGSNHADSEMCAKGRGSKVWADGRFYLFPSSQFLDSAGDQSIPIPLLFRVFMRCPVAIYDLNHRHRY